MIAEARKRARGLNLPVQFGVADAERLEFPANTFDGDVGVDAGKVVGISTRVDLDHITVL